MIEIDLMQVDNTRDDQGGEGQVALITGDPQQDAKRRKYSNNSNRWVKVTSGGGVTMEKNILLSSSCRALRKIECMAAVIAAKMTARIRNQGIRCSSPRHAISVNSSMPMPNGTNESPGAGTQLKRIVMLL